MTNDHFLCVDCIDCVAHGGHQRTIAPHSPLHYEKLLYTLRKTTLYTTENYSIHYGNSSHTPRTPTPTLNRPFPRRNSTKHYQHFRAFANTYFATLTLQNVEGG